MKAPSTAQCCCNVRLSRLGLPVFVCCWIIIACYCSAAAEQNKQDDLYQLLGVSRQATVKEIKQAYRRKALDTHPDKNKGVPPDEAAEAFRQVVNAFEILSDESSRKRYDRTGRRQDGSGGGGWNNHNGRQQQSQSRWHWNWDSYYRAHRLKDRFDVQQAQSRVLHVVSLAQLETIMLDDDGLLERNLLICFTTPLSEKQADDEMVFPYPFAAMSSQGIWWEDLLQTVRIKFYRSSELSRFFGVTAEQVNEKPIFIFAKRGSALTKDTAEHLPRIHTADRTQFETWVWQQIEVKVEFVNQHEHPVELYWIHGSKAHNKMTLQPNQNSTHTTMLSHEWYARDVRVDTHPGSPGRYKLTPDSSLGSWKIVSDTSPQQIIIQGGQCFDLSGHCGFWERQRECKKNPNFMNTQCQKTCGLCDAQGQHDEF